MVIPYLVGVTSRVQVVAHGSCTGAVVHTEWSQIDRKRNREVWTSLCV